MKYKEKLEFRLSKELKQKIKDYTKKTGVPASVLIRRLLEEKLK